MSEKQNLEKQVKVLYKQKKIWQYITVLLVLSVLILGTMHYRLAHMPHFTNEHALLDPAVEYIDQKDLITNVEPIKSFLDKTVAEHSQDFNISVYFESLNTGGNISVNKDMQIWPASLTKLPLAMVVMKKIENGEWRLNDQLVMLEDDIDSKSGDMYAASSIGSRFTVDQLLAKLLVDSDNTAYRILYRNISENDYKNLIAETGMEKLFSADGKITPKEYARLLRILYFSSFLKPENSEKILKLLSEATFKKFLSSGLPQSGVLFAHKYGENVEYGLFSDFGIVYVPNRPYLLAVAIEAKDPKKEGNIDSADEIMNKISSYIYGYVKNYNQ